MAGVILAAPLQRATNGPRRRRASWAVLMLLLAHRVMAQEPTPARPVPASPNAGGEQSAKVAPDGQGEQVARVDLPVVDPARVGFHNDRLEGMVPLIEEAIERRQMPGCVVAIGRHGQLAWLRAFGQKRLLPAPEPMTVDTVFDLASLTKPIATGTSVMILVERGKLRLRDKVSEHIEGFAEGGKESITVEQLMTHQSGLIADNAIEEYADGPGEAWKRIVRAPVDHEPGTKFVYSDVGFIVLGELIRKASGQDVHAFSQAHVFRPLGMSETGFQPAETLRLRAAPTEQRDGRWLQGEVHDPRASRLGGIAGHAGLFSTARDLAIYAQMMLQRGHYQGRQILSFPAVTRMTTAVPIANALRSPGWDKLSGYSSNRAELFSAAAFGHGGFTGTVIWIDPELDMFFIFLSNRVHPDGKGNVNHLAGTLATMAVASLAAPDLPVDLDRLPR